MSSVGGRVFPVAASGTWNDLPNTVISAQSLHSLCRHLNTDIFKRYFPDIVTSEPSGPCNRLVSLGHCEKFRLD